MLPFPAEADRRALPTPKARRPKSLFREVLPAVLLIGLGTASALGGLKWVRAGKPTPPPPVQKAEAREAVDVYTLGRTPTIAAGNLRYAILGLGQDETTGKQVVWIRSITSNRIGAFQPGDALFGSPVRLSTVSPGEVVLSFRGKPLVIPIQP